MTPFRIDIPQVAIDDLHARLDATRWPDRETVDDWSQGAPLGRVRALIEHWRHRYDWRRCEARLNALPNFTAEVDGLDIHFVHVRSSNPDALPMVLTHGWPGSFMEFLDVIGPLSEPQDHGGRREDAFHLVIPSLPGYGFSAHPRGTGWGVDRIAAAWGTLMTRLGYDRYLAQGGDWGSAVTRSMARQHLPGLAAIHLNMVIVFPEADDPNDDAEAEEAIAVAAEHRRWGTGYSTQQSTRPQTLAYALADSPVGQAAWIYEKLQAWTDNDGDPADALPVDAMLDLISLYWFTNSAGSSARLYWESFNDAFGNDPVDLPVACTIYPKEMRRPPRRWAERTFPNLIHWNRVDAGGHFAAFEQPSIFVDEVRAAFRSLR